MTDEETPYGFLLLMQRAETQFKLKLIELQEQAKRMTFFDAVRQYKFRAFAEAQRLDRSIHFTAGQIELLDATIVQFRAHFGMPDDNGTTALPKHPDSLEMN